MIEHIWCIKATCFYDETEQIVAVFSTKEKAEEYLSHAALKNPRWRRTFRQSSLLGGYHSAWIEEYDPDPYILDPVIKVKK